MQNITYKHLPALLLLILLLSGCFGFSGKTIVLTDALVKSFIKAQTELFKKGGELAGYAKKAESGNIDSGKAGYDNFLKIIQKAGFKDLKEYLETAAKVGLVFSVVQSDIYVDKMNQLFEDQKSLIGENSEFRKMLNDPDIPEETKKEIRKSLKEAENQIAGAKKEFDQNKEWADLVLNWAKKGVDEESAKIVLKHKDELEKMFTFQNQ